MFRMIELKSFFKTFFKKNNMWFFLLLITMLFGVKSSIAQTNENDSDDGIRLIAHRGGIVDINHSENSRAAILSAIERGYWMLEIDIRVTRDGKLILQHDADFKNYYNDPRLVSEMDWKEIKQLKSNVDGSRPLLFKEVIELIGDKTNLMLDIKGDSLSDSLYKQIEQMLNKHNILSSTFLLGRSRVKSHFSEGKAFHSIGFEELMEAVNTGSDITNRFLFEQGSHLNEEKIRKAKKHDVVVVAGINEFRYVQAEKDPWQGAKKDIDRLLSLGVKYYQIDSVYESLFK